VEKIIEFNLTDEERDMVTHTLASIQKTVRAAGIVDH
jgi:malate/lactate dehydrogenase